ncbi:hypothetical protein SAMN05216312_11115 [Cohnella sp. OV330]|uniref:hypothetical protein n=1 Tax=Cohnella sp. OV330 TaxID=1855288 RepID=UPI0008EC9C69|nr:hypothetical protein [Cohnella sp. OV330]SFB51330.1 hypothetical protein SAMN05216312_11115 [Cohnella sp. OV330]
MIMLTLGMGAVILYQIFLLRRGSACKRDRVVAFGVTGFAFVFAALAHYMPEWVNPNRAIDFVFGPVQSWIARK